MVHWCSMYLSLTYGVPPESWVPLVVHVVLTLRLSALVIQPPPPGFPVGPWGPHYGQPGLEQLQNSLEGILHRAKQVRTSGTRLNIKTIYQLWDFYYKDKMVVRPSYLYTRNPYTDKTASLYRDSTPETFICVVYPAAAWSCSRGTVFVNLCVVCGGCTVVCWVRSKWRDALIGQFILSWI